MIPKHSVYLCRIPLLRRIETIKWQTLGERLSTNSRAPTNQRLWLQMKRTKRIAAVETSTQTIQRDFIKREKHVRCTAQTSFCRARRSRRRKNSLFCYSPIERRFAMLPTPRVRLFTAVRDFVRKFEYFAYLSVPRGCPECGWGWLTRFETR